MHVYGLSDTLWAVIAANVTFATPYAILILQQYAKLIPIELDEAAQVDGASPWSGVSAHLSAADDAGAGGGRHLCAAARLERVPLPVHAALLDRNMTVAVAIAQFFDSDEAPWNYMMATAIVYARRRSRSSSRCAATWWRA